MQHFSAVEEKTHSIGADDAGLVKRLDRRGNLVLLSILKAQRFEKGIECSGREQKINILFNQTLLDLMES